MILECRYGARHGNADALSLYSIPVSREYYKAFKLDEKPSNLPCGGCDYCTRADRIWDSLARVVNCTVTMASQGLHRIMASNDECTKVMQLGSVKLVPRKCRIQKPGNDEAPLKKYSCQIWG